MGESLLSILSYEGGILKLLPSGCQVESQLTASCLGTQQKMAQVLGHLPLTLRTWMEFLVYPDLATAAMRGLKQ